MIKAKNIDPDASIASTQLATTGSLADGKIWIGNGSAVATACTPSGDITMTNVGVTAVGTGKLTAKHAGTVANANVIGGIPVVYRVDIADGAGNTDVVLTYKTRVTDVVVVKTNGAGGAGDTIQVKNAATAITDAISINVADKAVARVGTIDDAQHEIAASGTMRITAGHNTDNTCVVYVMGMIVA